MDAITVSLPVLLESGNTAVAASYRRDDPYAVTLGFDAVRPGVEWVLARDLFCDALIYGQAGGGAGDVTVTVRADLVVLGLSTPDGAATAIFRRDDVADFLGQTHQIVRAGQETAELDWSDVAEFPGVAL